MLMKMKKKLVNIQKSQILKKIQKWSGDMAESYLSTKSGINSLDGT